MRNTFSRTALNFPAAVRVAFHFLGEFGFQEIDAEETIVRYATDRIFLNVYHGRSSYEIGIEVGLLDENGSDAGGYSLSEFIRLTKPEEGARLRYFCATTPDEVQTGLERLAAQVKQHVARALKGDETIFPELEHQQQEWARAFAADVGYRQVSPKAAEAFRQKEYQKAAELYESIREKLTPAELTKLEYAKKHT